MKIFLPFDFAIETRLFLLRCGYHEFNDPNTGKTSFIRRLQRDYYPRYHIYVESDLADKKILNLHLDQKKPSYQGAHAHSAEYDSDIVQREAERLQGLIKNQLDNQTQTKSEPAAENLWQKLFGR